MTRGAELEAALSRLSRESRVVVLTGAGISAESGIPTFRGPEGYWTVGSRNYRAEELATWSAFQRMPAEIWSWYLYRRSVCLDARPNDAHRALVTLDAALGDRLRLITQNVDGLHVLAGSPLERTFEVHGNVHFVRCANECSADKWRLPGALDRNWERERRLTPAELALLVCPCCGAPGRPHVLWFDETYDEERYLFESAVGAAGEAELFVVIGTTGTTGLPQLAARTAARAGATLIAVDPDADPFGTLFARKARIESRAVAAVPSLVEALVRVAGEH